MTTALRGGEVPASRPGRSLPRERPGTHCTGGWVGPRARLDRCGKSRLTGVRSPDRPARSQSLYRLSYPAHKTEGKYTNYMSIVQELCGDMSWIWPKTWIRGGLS